MNFVLVHSPLVGPGTWAPVQRELERRGHHAVVPSLLGPEGTGPQSWRGCVAAVSDTLRPMREAVVLVGHSASGILLPAISQANVTTAAGLVFVDSDLPAKDGETPLAPPELLDRLRVRAAGGLIPPWWAWWAEDVRRELVPNDVQRVALEDETPSLPLSYFEDAVPSPAGWDDVPCAYLRLSDAYGDAAAEARTRSWPVFEIDGAHHLWPAVAPGAVADCLVRLAGGWT